MYTERLRGGEEDRLKVHCYRALLEKLLVSKDPGLRHTQLKTVARAHQLDFPTYVRQASLAGFVEDFVQGCTVYFTSNKFLFTYELFAIMLYFFLSQYFPCSSLRQL